MYSQLGLRVFCSTRKCFEVKKCNDFLTAIFSFPSISYKYPFSTIFSFLCISYRYPFSCHIPQSRSCSDHFGDTAGDCTTPRGILTAESPFLILCVASDRVNTQLVSMYFPSPLSILYKIKTFGWFSGESLVKHVSFIRTRKNGCRLLLNL